MTPTWLSAANPRRPTLAATAWALALLLLPPMACSGTAAPTAPAAPAARGDLISMLPADATTIGFIDFAALRSSPLYEFAKREGAAFGDAEELENIVAETGIDPRTDLHQIAFVSRGSGIVDIADESAVLVMATFDRAAVQAKLAAGTASTEYQGFALYELASWRTKDNAADESAPADIEIDLDRSYAIILDDSTLGFGGEGMLREIVDVSGGARSARSNVRLMGLLADVDEGGELWAVSAQDDLFTNLSPGDRGMPQIPVNKIKSMIVSARLTRGIDLVVRGRTERQEDAKLLGDSLNGMLAFGKMMLQSNSPEVFQILDRGVTAGSSGFDVNVRANLTVEDLDALYAFARNSIGGTEAP